MKQPGTIFPFVRAAIFDKAGKLLATGFDAPNPLARALQRLCRDLGYAPADLRIRRDDSGKAFRGDSPEGAALLSRPLSPVPDAQECRFNYYVKG